MQSTTIPPFNPPVSFPSNLPRFAPTIRHFPPPSKLRVPTAMASTPFGLAVRSRTEAAPSGTGTDGLCTLTDFVGKGGIGLGDDLVLLLTHIQYACKRIAALVASPFSSDLQNPAGLAVGSERDAPKPLDIVSVSKFSFILDIDLIGNLFYFVLSG